MTVEGASVHHSRSWERWRRPLAWVRSALLNIAAVGGAVCILSVLAALLFDISLILFKTGSMSPTIPAGSLAVVRQIPASEVREGDVLTVDRPGKLPVTHRVLTVEGEGELRVVTMQGDANPSPDAEPYTISDGRLVLASAPYLAYPLASVSNPVSIGAITLAVSALVTWTLWPRGRNK